MEKEKIIELRKRVIKALLEKGFTKDEIKLIITTATFPKVFEKEFKEITAGYGIKEKSKKKLGGVI